MQNTRRMPESRTNSRSGSKPLSVNGGGGRPAEAPFPTVALRAVQGAAAARSDAYIQHADLPQRSGAEVVALHRMETTPAAEPWRELLARADAFEMRIVHGSVALTRYNWVRSATLAVNLLGNGWIYLPLALALLLYTAHARSVIGVAVLATGIAHACYALIKRGIARPRPFVKDARLTPLARALDQYSFPSGHCMTLTAVLTPVVTDMPALWPFAAAALAVLACCRLTAAHHYPTDVIAGIALGAAIALPCSAWLLRA
jgi:undecaprenyl-diphosphatase